MTQGERPVRMVFICVENSNRSQMAEAFARIYGAGKVESYSAGSRPSGYIHPKAIEAMRELNYDLTRHQSKSLTDLPDGEFDVVVTMGCGDKCPNVRARRREDWNIPCPKAMPLDEFRAVRDLIGKKFRFYWSNCESATRPPSTCASVVKRCRLKLRPFAGGMTASHRLVQAAGVDLPARVGAGP